MIFTTESAMPYGRHRGVPLKDVPAAYLLYAYQNHRLDWGLSDYIEENLVLLNQQAGTNVQKFIRE